MGRRSEGAAIHIVIFFRHTRNFITFSSGSKFMNREQIIKVMRRMYHHNKTNPRTVIAPNQLVHGPLLDFGDGFGGVQMLRASLGTVHNSVAPVKLRPAIGTQIKDLRESWG